VHNTVSLLLITLNLHDCSRRVQFFTLSTGLSAFEPTRTCFLPDISSAKRYRSKQEHSGTIKIADEQSKPGLPQKLPKHEELKEITSE